MFDIRLRLYTPEGVKGRVIPASSLTVTQLDSATSQVKFTLSDADAGRLESPFIVGVEYTTGGTAWRSPRNDLHICESDSGDALDATGTMTFTGLNYVAWLLARANVNPTGDGVGGKIENDRRLWTTATAGRVMAMLINEAKNRGWGPNVTIDFTDDKDSAGMPWVRPDDLVDEAFSLYSPVSTVLNTISEQGLAEWWTEGMKLRMVRLGSGNDRTHIVLGAGTSASASPVKSSFAEVFTHLRLVLGEDAARPELANPGADNRFGRLEATMTQSGVKDTAAATRNAQPTLARGKSKLVEQSVDWAAEGWGDDSAVPAPSPWAHFHIGDAVTVRSREARVVQRVAGLVVEKGEEGITIRATVGDRLNSLTTKLAKRTAAASVGGIIGGTGNALPAAPTAALPQPAAPQGVRVASDAPYWRADGSAASKVTVAWQAVEVDTEGAFIDVLTYEVWARVGNETSSTVTRTADLSATVDTWEPGVTRFVKVRAQSAGGVWSTFSNESAVTPTMPVTIVPKPPTNVRVTSNTAAFTADGAAVARVVVEWEAVTTSLGNEPVAIEAYEVEVEEGAAWVPLVPVLSPRRVTLDVTSGEARRLLVRARSDKGVVSDPSTFLAFTGAIPAQVKTPASAPTLATSLGIVTVSWDGELAGGAAVPAGFMHAYVEVRTGTTGAWTRAAGAPASTAGQVAIVRSTVGSQLSARLVWVDGLGRVADASAATTITVSGVSRADLEDTITRAIDEAYEVATAAGVSAAQAVSGALTAQEAAEAAQQAAQAADDAAASAAGIAGGKADVLIQSAAPATDMRKATTLWIDTTNSGNKPKRWNGSDWVTVTDKAATDAATAAANAASAATAASGQAAAAQSAADQAAAAASAAQSTATDAVSKAAAAQSAATVAQGTAATAKSAADTAKSAADAAQATAAQAGSAAASAAGIADGKADVLIQATAPATDMRKPTTLWIDTTGGANKPKRWSGSEWLAVTDKTATDAATAAANAASAASTANSKATAAQTAADNAAAAATAAQRTANEALTAAGTAQSTANAAIESASGRNAMYHSTTAPSGVGTRTGDLWHQWSSMAVNGRLLGVWVWNGQWQKRTLDETYLPLVNIGAGTYGSLRGDRLEANTVATSKLLVGDFTNLVEDPYFDLRSDDAWQGGGGTFVEDAWQGHPYSLRIGASGARYQAPIPVAAGDRFRFECFFKASGWPASGGSGGLRLERSADGGKTFASFGSTNFTNAADWTQSVVEATAPAGTTHIRARIAFAQAGSTSTVNGVSLRRMNGGELLVDGSVGAKKVNAAEIWADEAWLNTLRAGVIETPMLAAGVGESLDITANGQITLLLGNQQTQGAELAATQETAAKAAENAGKAATEAGTAAGAAKAAQQTAEAAKTAQEKTQKQLDDVAMWYRFGVDGAIIGKPGSNVQLHLKNTGAEIHVGTNVVSTWDSLRMHVPSLVATKVVLGNHQFEKFGNRTVVRAI